MNPLGLYSPGTSVVHRFPAGPGLLVVLVLTTVTLLVPVPAVLAGLVVLTALGYAVARVPWARTRPLLRLLVLLVALVGALQGLLVGWEAAVVTSLRLVVALSAATLFTMTTRVDDVVAAVERGLGPLRRFGVRPERAGIAVGLTVAAIGVLSGIADEVRQAALARGAGRSVTAFATPFVIRTLQHADELGEALAARGMGED